MNSSHVSMHNPLVTETSRLGLGKRHMHSHWLQFSAVTVIVACLCLC